MKDKDQAQPASLVQTARQAGATAHDSHEQVSNIAEARGVELKMESLASKKGLAFVSGAP